MKTVLIISPHFPPSNLAAVHRSRLFAQHLPSFGWKPIILAVDEEFYEEKLDWNLQKLLPAALRIEKVKAFKITRPRIVGDIGLRGFYQLYKRAKQLIKAGEINFVYIPIPSFYIALLGRFLHLSTGVRYGIDYIDPWVHHFPGSDKVFSRHWFSTKVARILEPIAVKSASIVTGVAAGYYQGVQDRNPQLKKHCLFDAMPYGGEKADHDKLQNLGLQPYLFNVNKEKLQLVYAGAMLPKAFEPLERLLNGIQKDRKLFGDVEFHFIGTGTSPDDKNGYNIKALAEKYGLWQTVIFEYPARIAYLDVLVHLNVASGVFILGSTEPHYTPSKVYQGVLSKKPIWAVLHTSSTACQVIRDSGAGIVLDFNGEEDVAKVSQNFAASFSQFKDFMLHFDAKAINQSEFEKYSAYNVTKTLAKLLDTQTKTRIN